ncbi:hypothetical protein K501DRAFT_289322 [Backusella circina FSU 941]|nr:hypothetical protein K501DRAFT_289322 [Backusella circina FSU 941]
MTSSRSEFVQNAIDSAIASRSIDVHEYLSGPRRPILEQPDPTSLPVVQQEEDGNTSSSIPVVPVDEPLAPIMDNDAAPAGIAANTTLDSVAQNSSANEPDLQEAINYATKNAVNAPTVDVYGYLEKANPMVPPSQDNSFTGDKQTPAQEDTGLNQETLPLSDNVENAIQSAVNSGGIDSQSYLDKSSSSNAAEEAEVLFTPDIATTDTVGGAIDGGIATTDTSGDVIDEGITNKLSDDAMPSVLNVIDDGAREPQHSEADSARRTPIATDNFGNEIDSALANAISSNDNNAVIQEEEPTPPLPPKEELVEPEDSQDQVPLDTTNGKTDQLDVDSQQNTDNSKDNLKDSTKAVAAAVGASVAATTAGVASFASDKKDKLKAKVNETVDKVGEPDLKSTQVDDTKPSFTPVTDDPLSQGNVLQQQPETDISDQAISQERIDAKPPPPEPPVEAIQNKPTPPEPIQDKPTPPEPFNESEPIQDKPTPPEPIIESEPIQDKSTLPEPVTTTTLNEPAMPAESTPPEPVAQGEPTQPEPAVTESKSPEVPTPNAPEPPTKHHHHHKLLPNRPGHHGDEKGKKCLIM